MKISISVALVVLLSLSAILLMSCTKDALCGNGKIDAGEDAATCCRDAGCVGGQVCADNACKDPVCSPRQYLDADNHTCVEAPRCGSCGYFDVPSRSCQNFTCCEDAACAQNEQCVNHACKALQCDLCKYAENHTCKTPACCEDSDCDDSDEVTKDSCKSPLTKSAKCVHESQNKCAKDADCKDRDLSTVDYCSTDTPRVCVHDLVTECLDGDGVCPDGCNYRSDEDCEEAKIICKNDNLTCFYDALDDCIEAEVTISSDNSTNDVDMEIKTKITIKRLNSRDECEVALRTQNVDMSFTDDYIAELEDDGLTDAEIQEKEDAAIDKATEVEGYDSACKFDDTDDMVDILNNWEDGDYSIKDFEDYCTGDYFN